MLDLLRSKFSRHKIRDLLLSSGDDEIIEGNNHGDKFWGVTKGEGKNMLGKLLMQVREEVRKETEK
jgi:predicted NAD-dependent protein-ADP-ribosyltransferase YbiA (DUF1768 family)